MAGPLEAPGLTHGQDSLLPFWNQLVEVCPPPPQSIQADQHVITDRYVNRPKIKRIKGKCLTVECRCDETRHGANLPTVALLRKIKKTLQGVRRLGLRTLRTTRPVLLHLTSMQVRLRYRCSK